MSSSDTFKKAGEASQESKPGDLEGLKEDNLLENDDEIEKDNGAFGNKDEGGHIAASSKHGGARYTSWNVVVHRDPFSLHPGLCQWCFRKKHCTLWDPDVGIEVEETYISHEKLDKLERVCFGCVRAFEIGAIEQEASAREKHDHCCEGRSSHDGRHLDEPWELAPPPRPRFEYPYDLDGPPSPRARLDYPYDRDGPPPPRARLEYPYDRDGPPTPRPYPGIPLSPSYSGIMPPTFADSAPQVGYPISLPEFGTLHPMGLPHALHSPVHRFRSDDSIPVRLPSRLRYLRDLGDLVIL